MKNNADLFNVASFIAYFVSDGVIAGFKPALHDLVCNPFLPADCLFEIRTIALIKLIIGVCAAIAAYQLFKKTSTPVGTNIAVLPVGQAPVTQTTNPVVPGMQYAPIDAKGNVGESIPINGIQVKAGA